jgi:hypothetical protein
VRQKRGTSVLDEYARRIYEQQELNRLLQARDDAQRLAKEQAQYWTWFYRQCDLQDEALRERARDANREAAYGREDLWTRPQEEPATWSESSFTDVQTPPDDALTSAYRDIVGECSTTGDLVDLLNRALANIDETDRQRAASEAIFFWSIENGLNRSEATQILADLTTRWQDEANRPWSDESTTQRRADDSGEFAAQTLQDSFSPKFDALIRDDYPPPSQSPRDDAEATPPRTDWIDRLETARKDNAELAREQAQWWKWFYAQCDAQDQRDLERRLEFIRGNMAPPAGNVYETLLGGDYSADRVIDILADVSQDPTLETENRARLSREIFYYWKMFYAQFDKDLDTMLHLANERRRQDQDADWRRDIDDRVRQDENRYSEGYLNRVFMNWALKEIKTQMADHPDGSHPLRKLLDESGAHWQARVVYTPHVSVQAGHLTSGHSKAQEFFAIEDSLYNKLSNDLGESKGRIFLKEAVDIGGIPVERRTAEMWERNDVIPKGTVANAAPHPGWTRKRVR